MYTFKFFSPKPSTTNRECEDAYPLCETDKSERLSVFGVFDGVGATGTTYHEKLGHSSAYLGSDETKKIFEQKWHENNFEDLFEKEETEIRSIFEAEIFNSLLKFAKDNELFADIKVQGSIIALLPTTAAVAFCRKNFDESGETNSVDVICIWAGDSRCYSIDSTGLHQLTKDDQNTDSDAFESMIDQPSMSNAIQINKNEKDADKMQFKLNCKKYSFNESFFILCSTDGCYEYCSSPMHFEKAILDSIIESIASTEREIEQILKSNLNTHMDDCTLSAGFFDLNKKTNVLSESPISDKESHLKSYGSGLLSKLKIGSDQKNEDASMPISSNNDDAKEFIVSLLSERRQYLDSLIGESSNLQKTISERNAIQAKINENEENIKGYLKCISDYISNPESQRLFKKDFPEIEKLSPNGSLHYLLNKGSIEEHLPKIYGEYKMHLSDKDKLNNELSEKNTSVRSNLREIWSEYKKEYEKYYNISKDVI